jgi:hypothetical protein
MKKLNAVLAAMMIAMMMTSTVSAAEITEAGTGSSDAVLTTESATFSVTVPMSLPIHVDASGTVTVSDTAKIVNNSHGAVKVTGVDVVGVNGWSVIDFDTEVSTLKVGAKEFGFMLNGGKTVDGALGFNQENYPVLEGANDTASDELVLTYDAIAAPQSTALADEKIADVVFTVDWNN